MDKRSSFLRPQHAARDSSSQHCGILPSIAWSGDAFNVSYQWNCAYPDLQNLLDYVDNSDPLNIYRGNPHLQRSTTHRVALSRSWTKWRERQIICHRWGLGCHTQCHCARTNLRCCHWCAHFSPRNVDGNWHAAARMFWERPFDKDRQTLFTSETKTDFRNSVDFVTERSTVQKLCSAAKPPF